jgi:protocatechuate 3,4-dioxygenase beta subunit
MTDAESTIVSMISRRRALGLLGAFSVVGLAACADDGSSSSDASSAKTPSTTATPSTTSPTSTTSPAATDVGVIPEETAGPFPGDGSNGPNALTQNGVVRQDIRSSFGGATGTAAGVLTTLKLRIVDTTKGGAAVPNAAVYVWHCDREGRYSMYSDGVTDENYLRGVQETAADGSVQFSTIFPACYDGRWPHMHFEVYQSLDSATSYSSKLRTSQLAIPEDRCREVYGVVDGYDASVDNLDRVSLDTDLVFSDGYSLQLVTVTGSAEEGYTFSLNVPV